MKHLKHIKAGIRVFALLLIAVVMIHSSVASALDDATQGLLFPMYGENGPVCGDAGVGGTTPAKGSDNETNIFIYFLNKGLTPYQIAGIMGNLYQESRFNPKAQQDGSKDDFPKNTVGFGLAQWTFTSRQAPLVRLAKSRNVKPNTLQVQMDYMWQELNKGYKISTLTPLKAIKSNGQTENVPVNGKQVAVDKALVTAALLFHNAYEGSADTRFMIRERAGYGYESLQRMIKNGVVKKGDENKVSASSTEGATGVESSDCGEDGEGSGGEGVDGYWWPRAPLSKKAYRDKFPKCKPTFGNGAYTRNYMYTDTEGNRNKTMGCHHDATPAYDLMAKGGEAVYAITDGTIVRRNSSYGGVSGCHSITFKSVAEADGYYYWYGHLQNGKAAARKIVAGGTKIAEIAREGLGSSCWLGGVHLHIDSGCTTKSGTPLPGGNDGCRRPSFEGQMIILYEALPS
jgi:hypothetical protein